MRNLICAFAFFFLVLTSWPTYAAWVTTELEAPKSGGPRLSLQYLGTQYATDSTLDTQSNRYQYVIPRLYSKAPEGQSLQWEVDFNAVLPASEAGEAHYFFPDLYVGAEFSDSNISYFFGRKQQRWSDLDDHLHLGLWQPLFRWDQARPVEMGLTGLHIENRRKYFQLHMVLSPFFLPDQQAEYQNEDGKLSSGNRWFRRPIRFLEIANGEFENSFDVKEPEVKEVVLNETYALTMRAGERLGPFARLSLADKPMNQFHLGIDSDSGLNIDSRQAQLAIYPYVVRHRLYTFETGYGQKGLRSFISYTIEEIERPEVPENYEETKLVDANYLGLGLSHDAPLPFLSASQLTWAFARRDEKEDPNKSTIIEGEWDASTQRTAFENWFSLKWQARKFLKKERYLEGNLGYSYSPSDDADWISADLTLNWTKSWQFYVSADLFGSGSADKIEAQNEEALRNQSFISLYRNNDRIQGGFVYVF